MTALTFPSTDAPTPRSVEEREAILANPGFGNHFTDHMVHAQWRREEGWASSQLTAYGPLSLEPGQTVLHYGQEVFEGLKAFRHDDGSVWTFRPERNGVRMQASARRMALPELPVEDFIHSLEVLVQADEAWVPTPTSEESLYLRPFMFGSEPYLGIRAAATVDYYVIASPAGNYFARGVQPLRVWITTDFARAGKGGTGAAKCGGNYASSLMGKQQAASHGADEVMFLDSETHTSIDELSGMNVFVVTADGHLKTPELTGSILAGVTRESVLQLGRDRGLTVREERLCIDDVLRDVADGSITEMFACGTAAVINPIGMLMHDGGEVVVGDGGSGKTTMALREELTGIQYGRIPDRHNWLHRLA